MENVKVKKTETLEILKANRAAHKKIFLEALEGYHKQAIEILEKHIENIKKGRVGTVNVSLPTPMDCTKDYDRAIKMLEMSVDDQIILDETSFSQYVMDDWNWKRQFLTSNSTYSLTAMSALNS